MSFVPGNLTVEQRKRIEENRQKVRERLNKGNDSKITNLVDKSATQEPITSRNPQPAEISIYKRPKVVLTAEQRKRIEDNRKKAIAIQKRLSQNNRDASNHDKSTTINLDSVRLGFEIKDDMSSSNIRPSINKKDYIEFDFSTMTDTRGGFINNEGSSSSIEPRVDNNVTLEAWKERQKEQQVIRDLPPPMDIAKAPKCYECGSLEIDPMYFSNFNAVRVCRKCLKEKSDKYSLLTKTECREDYLLTEPELKDTSLLPRIEKPNPHGYSRMQLFVRFQVEEFAWKKWGSAEGLDEEWERREAMKIKRRDKRYHEKLREMRKKTRAEEYTRKLRNGKSLGERHVHDWSAPLKVSSDPSIIKRRCIDCGVEKEQIII